MKIRLYSKPAQLAVDAAISAATWVTACIMLHPTASFPFSTLELLIWALPVALGQVAANAVSRIYRYQWRYIAGRDTLAIARPYILFAFVLVLVTHVGHRAALQLPLALIAFASVLSLTGALSVRLARRLLYQRSSAMAATGRPRRFLVVGAGSHGATVVREMLARKGIEVVGFLDDDPGKHNAVVAGVPVVGRTTDLAEIVEVQNVDEVLVCISPQARQSLRIDSVTSSGLHVRSRIIPTLSEVLETDGTLPVIESMGHPAGSEAGCVPTVIAASAVMQEHAGRPGNDRGPQNQDVVVSVDYARSGNGNGNGAQRARRYPSEGSAADTHIATALPAIVGKRILITGGAGFIGSALAEKLVNNNQITLLDQTFSAGPIHFSSLVGHPNVKTVVGNILDFDLRTLVQDTDVVVHAAAILGVGRVCRAGRETLETNYVGTSRLLKAMDANPNLERFIYFSTSEVFGVNSYRVDEGCSPTVGPIAESRWSYAMSKLAGEHLVASYFRETQLPITIVRPFNIFGPRRTGDYALLRFVTSALLGEPLEVHGDGTQIRSWCYIEDFCDALQRMIVFPQAIGEDFNIGHPGNTVTVYDLAVKVIELSGSSSPIHFTNSPFPDISIRVPSPEKARRLLGYKPTYDLNTGLKLTIDWHRANLSRMPATQRATGHHVAA